MAGELNSRGADAGRPAMDEEPFAAAQAPAHEDIGPDGEEGLAERCRLGHAHTRRHRQRVILMRERIFRIAAPGQKRGDGVALPSSA
jgi:hypothetical protein